MLTWKADCSICGSISCWWLLAQLCRKGSRLPSVTAFELSSSLEASLSIAPIAQMSRWAQGCKADLRLISELCCAQLLQSGLTFCDPMVRSLPGSSVPGYSWQEYYSGLPFPSQEDLPDPGMEPMSPLLQVDSLSAEPLEAQPPRDQNPSPYSKSCDLQLSSWPPQILSVIFSLLFSCSRAGQDWRLGREEKQFSGPLTPWEA